MKRVDVEARVSRIAWPAPPIDLRARVLSAVPAASPVVTWSDRVWFSRGWRLAAVAAVLILAVLESMSGPARSRALPASAQAIAEASVIEETARQAGLSPDQATALARWAAATDRHARSGAHFDRIALDDFDFGGDPR
jgi:hypothetical protein